MRTLSKEQNMRLFKLGLPIILGTILLLGVSYAWLTLILSGTKTNVLKAGTLSLVLDDTMGDGILLEKQMPITDEEGTSLNPYTFILTNDGTIDSEYTIYLDDIALEDNEVRMSDSVVKYQLIRDENVKTTNLLNTTGENPNRVLDTGIIPPGTSYTYKLKLWIDKDAENEVMGNVFKGQIRILATQVIEPIPTN